MTSHVIVKTVTVIKSHDKEKQWCYTIWLLYVCYQEIGQKRNIVLAEVWFHKDNLLYFSPFYTLITDHFDLIWFTV